MMEQESQLSIAFGGWVYRYFAPDIESYCDILLNRINPVFDDVEGEQQRAADDFMGAASSHFHEDYEGAVEAAYEHAIEHAQQFIQMRAVFLATGVSGLFHVFEKQLYRHINKELEGWLTSPINQWRDLESMIPKFNRKWRQDTPCTDFNTAFNDSDLQELRLVANAVKHGDEGPSFNQLVKNQAVVVSKDWVKDDWTVGPYSVLGVNLSVQAADVMRYRDAVLRFWNLDGTFYAPRKDFK